MIGICGSLPAGAPTGLHARLVETARGLGAFVILDSSTPEALAAGIAAGPDLAAPNLAEAAAVLGIDPAAADPAALAEALRDRGAAAVWLSLGAEGSVFADGDGTVRVTAPEPERIVNAVGCGDALIGGFAAALLARRDRRSAIALGAAAAADKLTHLHPGRVERAAVEGLVPEIGFHLVAAEAAA